MFSFVCFIYIYTYIYICICINIYNIYMLIHIYICICINISLMFMIVLRIPGFFCDFRSVRMCRQVGLTSELKELALTALAEWAAQLASNPKQGIPATHDLCSWASWFHVETYGFLILILNIVWSDKLLVSKNDFHVFIFLNTVFAFLYEYMFMNFRPIWEIVAWWLIYFVDGEHINMIVWIPNFCYNWQWPQYIWLVVSIIWYF